MKDTFFTLKLAICSKEINGSYVIIEISKELASLKMYAKWCYQLTPRVSLEKENTIVLNIEGCTRLFGNTSNILKIINKNFDDYFIVEKRI